jgi:hypothetical protein
MDQIIRILIPHYLIKVQSRIVNWKLIKIRLTFKASIRRKKGKILQPSNKKMIKLNMMMGIRSINKK